jgi:hypothetical protein
MSTDLTRPSGVNGDALSLDDDILIGAENISKFLYGPEEGLREKNLRRTYHGIAKGDIPTFTIGGKRHARKSTILRWIADQERTA